MKLELTRFESTDQGTFGRLGQYFTLERQWLDNQSGISCIPEGEYKVIRTRSLRLHRITFRLLGTAPRDGILIHSANLSTQLQGCIALGEKIGWLDGKKALLLSRPAVAAFERAMPDKWTLVIRGEQNA